MTENSIASSQSDPMTQLCTGLGNLSTLPREIRDYIYKLSFAPAYGAPPNPDDYDEDGRPIVSTKSTCTIPSHRAGCTCGMCELHTLYFANLGVLQVSKAVHLESSSILYSESLFTFGDLHQKLYHVPQLASTATLEDIRNVEININRITGIERPEWSGRHRVFYNKLFRRIEIGMKPRNICHVICEARVADWNLRAGDWRDRCFFGPNRLGGWSWALEMFQKVEIELRIHNGIYYTSAFTTSIDIFFYIASQVKEDCEEALGPGTMVAEEREGLAIWRLLFTPVEMSDS